jgi:DNA topoisomerase I
VRDATKFSRMVAFGEALPALRARVHQDLQRKGLPRAKVLATVVRLLESTSMRIGNEEYRRQNGSFGLTTLRRRHVAIDGHTLLFRFTGKGGKRQQVLLTDRRLARILRDCHEIPGYELFQYLDQEGHRHAVDSADINDYLREAGGGDFTAKDFRTWMGSLLALGELRARGPSASPAEAERELLEVVDGVAGQLGNSRAICRQFYIHPELLEGFLEGRLFEQLDDLSLEALDGLSEEESILLALLRAHRPGSSSRKRRP